MNNEQKWPCGCRKQRGETTHTHTFRDESNRRGVCQVLHDHWEGPMICGNELPCSTHGTR